MDIDFILNKLILEVEFAELLLESTKTGDLDK